MAKLICLLSIWLVSCSLHAASEQKPAPVLPALHIQPQVYVLGDIPEGEQAVATFIVRNNNAQPIELMDIQASCGCTTAMPDSFVIAPGGFTTLRVTVDTTAKQNDIKKQVYVTDSMGHQAMATLEFSVVDNPHQKLGQVKGIFDGTCASCHFKPLVGVQAPDKLFAVGCAMCHGEQGKGAYAPKLRHYPSLAALKHIIAQGVGRPQMPGFAQSQGGPLTMQQIDDLARWLVALPEEDTKTD